MNRKLYSVTATVNITKPDGWVTTRQVPSFILTDSCGDETSAAIVAERIIRSGQLADSPPMQVHTTVVEI